METRLRAEELSSLRRAAVVWARAQAPSSLAVPALLRRGL